MDDFVVIEIWYQAVNPESAAYCNYYLIPKRFCRPMLLRFMASCFRSLFIVCESVYGCRQFTPLFKIIPWSLYHSAL